MIAEYNLASGSPALTAVNTWGLDLSNSRQGAGGVGGLLARTTGGATRSYTFDGNGNVSELVNGTGTLAGHYEYGPFGQTTAQVDSDASGTVGSNPYRFSTKPIDVQSGLYYYGYRYYNPVDGRWINRDPLGEDGGINLYGYVSNNTINSVDSLGLDECENLGERKDVKYSAGLTPGGSDPTKEALKKAFDTLTGTGVASKTTNAVVGIQQLYGTAGAYVTLWIKGSYTECVCEEEINVWKKQDAGPDNLGDYWQKFPGVKQDMKTEIERWVNDLKGGGLNNEKLCSM